MSGWIEIIRYLAEACRIVVIIITTIMLVQEARKKQSDLVYCFGFSSLPPPARMMLNIVPRNTGGIKLCMRRRRRIKFAV